MSCIRVTIDRLTLQGFDPAERSAIVAGLKSELQRSLADTKAGAVWKARRTPVLRLHIPHQPGPSGSRTMGYTVARAIGKGVKP